MLQIMEEKSGELLVLDISIAEPLPFTPTLRIIPSIYKAQMNKGSVSGTTQSLGVNDEIRAISF
jgi:hypothetical protein